VFFIFHQQALSRLKEMDFVLIYERFAESLKLFECRTGLGTMGHREKRRAVSIAEVAALAAAKGGGQSLSSCMINI
jgi:hypothetical protein